MSESIMNYDALNNVSLRRWVLFVPALKRGRELVHEERIEGVHPGQPVVCQPAG